MTESAADPGKNEQSPGILFRLFLSPVIAAVMAGEALFLPIGWRDRLPGQILAPGRMVAYAVSRSTGPAQGGWFAGLGRFVMIVLLTDWIIYTVVVYVILTLVARSRRRID